MTMLVISFFLLYTITLCQPGYSGGGVEKVLVPEELNPNLVKEELTSSLVQVSVGRTAAIQCNVSITDQTNTNLTVSWLRIQDVNLLAVGESIYTQDSRISVQCENITECYLYIAEVRESDSGLYRCQANLPPGKWDTRLEVVNPETRILGDKEVYINPNSLLNLTCQVFSPEPPHAIFWKYGEKVLSRSLPVQEADSKPPWSANLLIYIQQRTESGRYVCSPSNTGPQFIQLHVVDGEALLAKQSGNSLTCFSLATQLLISILLSSIFGSMILNQA